jgi:hypothetical protein
VPANLTPVERNRLLDDSLPTSGLFVALTSTTPSDASTGTELAGNGYSRQALPLTVASDSAKSNTAPVIWGPATADWLGVQGLEVWTASSGGSRRWYFPLNRTVKIGDRVVIGTGAMALQATKPAEAAVRMNALRDLFTGGVTPGMWDTFTAVPTGDRMRFAATQTLVSVPIDPRGSFYTVLLDASELTAGALYTRIFSGYPSNLTNYVGHLLRWDTALGKHTMTMGEAVNDVDQPGTVTVDVPGGIVLVRIEHLQSPEGWKFQYMLPTGEWVTGTTVTAVNPMPGNARVYFRATSNVPAGQFGWVDNVNVNITMWGPIDFSGLANASGAGDELIVAPSVTATADSSFVGSGGRDVFSPALAASGDSVMVGSGTLLIPGITPTLTGVGDLVGGGTALLVGPTTTLSAASDFVGSGSIVSGVATASSISEDFADNDTVGWTLLNSVLVNKVLTGTATGAANAAWQWTQPLTLYNNSIYWKTGPAINGAAYGFGDPNNYINYLGFYNLGADGTTFQLGELDSTGLFTGPTAVVTLAPGDWLSLAHDLAGGGTVYWYTSTDGINWTLQLSRIMAPSYLTNGHFGGQTVAGTAGQKVTVASVNTFPAPPAAVAPVVTTQSASSVSTSSATLNGIVNPGGASTAYSFQWGLNNTYGNTAVGSPASPLTGTSDVPVSATISGLTAGTTYHYRLTATNSVGGPINSTDGTFVAAASVTTPSVLNSEQVTNIARVNANNGDNSWGGNQNRVIEISNGSTADGVYCIYQISDGQASADGLGGRTWQLKKRTGTNSWTVIATGPVGGVEWACPSIACDQTTGRIWICTWVNTVNYSNYTNGRIRVWTGIPNGTTFIPVDDPTSSPTAMYGVNSVYMSSALLPNGAVFMGEGFGAGAAIDANEYWTRNAAGAWTHSIKDVSTAGPDGKGTRWGYPHFLPDRQGGNGVWEVGNRDGTYADYGYSTPIFVDAQGTHDVSQAPVPYVYTQVNAWHSPDGSAATPTWTEHNVLWLPQQNTGTPQATQPYCGSTSAGSWVDKEGRLHVLTQYTPNRTTTGTTANPNPAVADKVKHTVLSTTGALLSQADVPGLSPGYCVFLENSAGELFILGSLGGTSTATLFSLPDRASALTGPSWTLNLGAPVEYSGIHEAGLRAGNRVSDTPSIGFVSTGYNTYQWARIQLPTATATVTAPSILLNEQATNDANVVAGNNGDDAWGGHQNKIVTIANGTSADGTYMVEQFPDSVGGKTFRVKKRTSTNVWTTIATGPDNFTIWGSPHIMADQASGRLFVSGWVNYTAQLVGNPQVAHAIPNGTTWAYVVEPAATAGTQSALVGRYNTNSPYTAAAILSNGSPVFHEGWGGDGADMLGEMWVRSGASTWARKRYYTSTAAFNPATTVPDSELGRYNYASIHPDRIGTGCWVVASRTNNWATAGYSTPNTPTPSSPYNLYVSDEVRVWRTPDITAATPTWTSYTGMKVPQQNTGTSNATNPYCASTFNGSWQDADGRVHVLISYTTNQEQHGTSPQVPMKTRHVIVDRTGVVVSADLVADSGFARFVENASGTLFALYSNLLSSTLTVYRFATRNTAAPSTSWDLALTAAMGNSGGISEAGQRVGNRISDTAELVYRTGANNGTLRYLKLQLPTG